TLLLGLDLRSVSSVVNPLLINYRHATKHPPLKSGNAGTSATGRAFLPLKTRNGLPGSPLPAPQTISITPSWSKSWAATRTPPRKSGGHAATSRFTCPRRPSTARPSGGPPASIPTITSARGLLLRLPAAPHAPPAQRGSNAGNSAITLRSFPLNTLTTAGAP